MISIGDKNVSLDFMRLKELWKGPGFLYAFSALLPMTTFCCLGLHGIISFWDKSLMAVDFGQQYINFFGLLKCSSHFWGSFKLDYSFIDSLSRDDWIHSGLFAMGRFAIQYT